MEQINRIAQQLFSTRSSLTQSVPNRSRVESFIERLLGLLFPHYTAIRMVSNSDLESHLSSLLRDLDSLILSSEAYSQDSSQEVVSAFAEKLPIIQGMLLEDAKAILAGDPAAKSIDEVIVAYPGFLAIAIFRVANALLKLNVPIIPRILTEHAHHRTGIDIHPGAEIGNSFVIDHGTGIVIGETTIIKDNVKLYQGVTLGALSVDKSLATTKRHPTIESNVVIYANATILGGETVIGENSVIGGNVWLTSSVPARSTVYHKESVSVRPGM